MGIFVNKYGVETYGCSQAQLVFWELLETFFTASTNIQGLHEKPMDLPMGWSDYNYNNLSENLLCIVKV